MRGLVRNTPLNAWLGRWLGDATGTSPVDAAQVLGAAVYDLALLASGLIGSAGVARLSSDPDHQPLRLLPGTVLAYLPRVPAPSYCSTVACLKCSTLVQLR